VHWIGVWWRQPDHYEWMSDYLASRKQRDAVRYLMVAVLINLATATSLLLVSDLGPQLPAQRWVAVALIVSMVAMALVWVLRWPTRFQSQVFSIVGTAAIAVVGLIEPNPATGLMVCAAFGGLAGYVAFFHSARLMVFTLGTALAVALICAERISAAGDAPMAAAKLLFLTSGVLAVPLCSQVLVHWLSVVAMKSSTDPLTGLRNRRSFYLSTPKLVATRKGGRRLSVLMIDLDNFKRVNDTHGHATGDRILIEVADTLREASEDETLIARVGGEEFLVAMMLSARDAFATAEAMRLAIAAAPWGVTASMGLSTVGLASDEHFDIGETLQRLVETADGAMYEAKRAGGNQIRHADVPVPRPG
jgi:diguanylate cyclase (GGDEF)-like protein